MDRVSKGALGLQAKAYGLFFSMKLDKKKKSAKIENSSEFYYGVPTIGEQMKYNYSKQRERILELLKSTGSHPTAAWLYEHLKGEFSNLSMGTVYRNLNILLDQGLVQKREFGSTFDRFEANIEPHYHFKCERCQRIIDLDIPVDEELNEKVRKATPYKATGHQIIFFGVCDECIGAPK